MTAPRRIWLAQAEFITNGATPSYYQSVLLGMFYKQWFSLNKSCSHDISLDHLNGLKGPNSYNYDAESFIELPNYRFPIPDSPTYGWKQGPKRHKPWPIKKIMISHEKVMRKSCEIHEKVKRKSREIHEKVMRESTESHEKVMRTSWESHEKVMRKSWENNKKATSNLWESPKKVMRKS